MFTRRIASVSTLVGLEFAALLALHHLGSYEVAAVGWGDISSWLAQTPPEDAIVAVVHLAALSLAWWLMTSTVLYVLASATRIPGLVRGVRWATVAPVRRMIDGALATSILVGSTLATPSVAVAAPANESSVIVELKEQPEADESSQSAYLPRPVGDEAKAGYEPAPAGDFSSTPPTLGEESPPTSTQPAPRSDHPPSILPSGHYVVRPGDNLWTIAEQHLATATGRPAHELDSGEVRSYWLRVIDANDGSVRSKNPDLVWPGERIDLP